jgi:hypothetical protein
MGALLDDRIDVIATDPHTYIRRKNNRIQAGGPLVQHAVVQCLRIFIKER